MNNLIILWIALLVPTPKCAESFTKHGKQPPKQIVHILTEGDQVMTPKEAKCFVAYTGRLYVTLEKIFSLPEPEVAASTVPEKK